MYLSNVAITQAIQDGSLIVGCAPGDSPIIGNTSVDLRLDRVEEAKIWDIPKLTEHNRKFGVGARELRIAQYRYQQIADEFLVEPPLERDRPEGALVLRRADSIVIRPLGFVLWQTKERIGTPPENAQYICFIDGRSTRARAGLVVHLTAPTIHATWAGNVTLEMCNLGPLDIVLYENDLVAQIVVAKLTSPPDPALNTAESVTQGQDNVTGTVRNPAPQ